MHSLLYIMSSQAEDAVRFLEGVRQQEQYETEMEIFCHTSDKQALARKVWRVGKKKGGPRRQREWLMGAESNLYNRFECSRNYLQMFS